MSTLKANLNGNSPSRRSFTIAIAGLCLALLAMLAFAQVAHQHANQTDADHCQLCIVMHTAAPAVAAAAIVTIIQFEPLAPAAEPLLPLQKRQIRLFIRPPPASC